MPLGVISRVSIGFWGDFWRKIAKRENQKNLSKTGSYGIAWDTSLRRGRGAQKGTPRVHHGVATLSHNEGLRHSVAVLRRGVAIVHRKQILYFCFQTRRIRTPIV